MLFLTSKLRIKSSLYTEPFPMIKNYPSTNFFFCLELADFDISILSSLINAENGIPDNESQIIESSSENGIALKDKQITGQC